MSRGLGILGRSVDVASMSSRLRKNPSPYRFFLTENVPISTLYFRTEIPYIGTRNNLMMTTVALPAPASAERYRRLSADALRRRALDRLYERRSALQNLILALENYQRSREVRRAHCIDFSVLARKYSSDSAQSRI
jgi:hypothetical protein